MKSNIRKWLGFSTGTLLGSLLLSAEVNLEEIPSDTQWMIHVDVQSLLQKEAWAQVLKPEITKIMRQKATNFPIDPLKVIDLIDSVSVHGPNFNLQSGDVGVLVVQGKESFGKIIRGALLAFGGVEDGQDSPIVEIESDPYPIYAINQSVFLADLGDERFAASRSLNQLNRFAQVLAGTIPNLATSKNLGNFDFANDSYVVVGAASGFTEHLELPPQARLFKLVEGLQCGIGENQGNLTIDLTLDAQSVETSERLVQITEGSIALAALSNEGPYGLTQLADSFTVIQEGKTVRMSAIYPVASLSYLIHGEPYNEFRADDALGGDSITLKITKSDEISNPHHLFDQNRSTRWAAKGEGQWIQFELKNQTTIEEFQIAWHKGNSRLRAFEIEASSDGIAWNSIYSGSSSGTESGFESYPIGGISTKWIQIKLTSPGSQTWHSLNEIQLNGITPSILSMRTSNDQETLPSNLLDHDYATRWATNRKNPSVEFKLDKTTLIQEAAIAWDKGDSRLNRVEIQVSLDRINWETILKAQSNGESNQLEHFNSFDKQANWVKLIGHGNEDSDWTSISEFILFGVSNELGK